VYKMKLFCLNIPLKSFPSGRKNTKE